MNVKAVKAQWTDRVGVLLDECKPLCGVDALKEKIQSGAVTVFETFIDEFSIGFFLVRVDVLIDGRYELVLLHAVSEVKGKTPIAHVLGVLLPGIAKEYGIKKVRVHSAMRKLDDFLEREGFAFQESVFVKDVA